MGYLKQLPRQYPKCMRELPIWALWRYERASDGRVTKVPYSANYFGKAKSNDATTWATFSQVIDFAQHSSMKFSGPAIAISSEYELVFIDVDHCIVGNDINTLGEEILNSFDQKYSEVSISKTGLHILTLGTIPKNFKNTNAGVEIYSSGRFCSLTGFAISNDFLVYDQSALNTVYEKYKTATKVLEKPLVHEKLSVNDAWIVEHAQCNNWRFSDLWAGFWEKHYPSQSEAELALCGILAFWTSCDTAQMDRLFRHSGLYREKWERADYRNLTLSKAIANCNKTLSDFMATQNRKGG